MRHALVTLGHPDHVWVNRLVLGRDLGAVRVGLYVEQPYAMWAGCECISIFLRACSQLV